MSTEPKPPERIRVQLTARRFLFGVHVGSGFLSDGGQVYKIEDGWAKR